MKAEIAKGEIRTLDVAGVKVDVVSVDGHLYGFEDTCTHRGCSLAKGRLEGTTLTCACHGSQFDVTSGAVLRGPAAQPVRSRSVRIAGDDLVVAPDLAR
jgi:nitrite reductase/ring-hydroxylating ferredoxin subunit